MIPYVSRPAFVEPGRSCLIVCLSARNLWATRMLSTPEALKHHINGRLLAHNHDPVSRGVFVQLLAHEPREDLLVVPAVAEPLLVWIVSGSVRVEERELGSNWLASDVSAGSFYLTHSPTPYEMRWRACSDDPFVVLHVYLGLAIYRRALADVFGPQADAVRLADVSGSRDPTVSSLMEMIRNEVISSNNPNEMYLEALALALAVHVVRAYGVVEGRHKPRRQMLQLFKLQRCIRAMETGLDRPLNLERLAEIASLSPFHFSRMFKQSTGCSPTDYFIRLKVAKARYLLRETDRSIVSIALELGYNSPSHFAQVFRREVGVSPRQYRS